MIYVLEESWGEYDSYMKVVRGVFTSVDAALQAVENDRQEARRKKQGMGFQHFTITPFDLDKLTMEAEPVYDADNPTD